MIIRLKNHLLILATHRRKVVVALVFCLITIALVEIWVMNRLSTYGEQIAKLEYASSTIKTENRLLENKIAEKSSLKEIYEKSTALGFNSTRKIQYLQPSGVAFNTR